jgi:flagellar motor switch protein FliG
VADSYSLRKAAVVLLSLPQEEAGQLLSRLNDKQIEAVTIEIAKLPRVDGEEQEETIREFSSQNPRALSGSSGGIELAKKLVERALGTKATDTFENVRQSIESLPFSFLRHVDAQNLLTFLNDEHPQTIALVLSHMPPSYGAEVIAGLTPVRQLEVIRRIATMERTNPEVVKEVEAGLERRMASVMSHSYHAVGGVENVAEILNITDRSTERALLDNLAEEDPQLVEDIRRRMFVFPDVVKLADKDIQEVLKHVESSQWALALKGQTDELTQKILGNMSKRAAAMLEEEMGYLGPVKLSEVEAVQQQIVDTIRRLEDTGEITVSAGEEEKMIA